MHGCVIWTAVHIIRNQAAYEERVSRTQLTTMTGSMSSHNVLLMLSESWRLVFTPKEIRKNNWEKNIQLILCDAQGSQVSN